MCTGLEVAVIGSSVLAAGGAVAGGIQQQKMANYQADQANADAETARASARVQADRIRKAGREQAARRWRRLASKLARVRRCVSRPASPAMQSRTLTTILNGMNTGARYNARRRRPTDSVAAMRRRPATSTRAARCCLPPAPVTPVGKSQPNNDEYRHRGVE